MKSYACKSSIYGLSCRGEKTKVPKRYLVNSSEVSEELLPDEAER